jgi:hypothetical protein
MRQVVVMVIGWVMGRYHRLTCEMHSSSRAPRGEKLLSEAGGMKFGSWRFLLAFLGVLLPGKEG